MHPATRSASVAIAGANDSTLLLANVQPGDAGSYTVTATNAGGTVCEGSIEGFFAEGHAPDAVDIGPGLFTGMRVGIAAGKAIAQALRIPMIGISSLDLLAFPLRHADRTIAAVIDARKGEVFYAFYRPVPGGVQRVTDPHVGKVDDLVADLMARGQTTVCVGDGALRYREEIDGDLRCDFAEQFLSHPSSAPLVQLAHAKALREDWVNPWEIQPLYLRAPDAQINWSTRESAG